MGGQGSLLNGSHHVGSSRGETESDGSSVSQSVSQSASVVLVLVDHNGLRMGYDDGDTNDSGHDSFASFLALLLVGLLIRDGRRIVRS